VCWKRDAGADPETERGEPGLGGTSSNGVNQLPNGTHLEGEPKPVAAMTRNGHISCIRKNKEHKTYRRPAGSIATCNEPPPLSNRGRRLLIDVHRDGRAVCTVGVTKGSRRCHPRPGDNQTRWERWVVFVRGCRNREVGAGASNGSWTTVELVVSAKGSISSA
jgi:hypothetical protein